MNSLARLTATCTGDTACSSAPVATGLLDEKSKEIVEMTLEVDYMKNCTTLYKMIEEQDWETVAKFLDTGYWIGSLWADRVTPADQAKTWVTRFDPEHATKIKWSQLPLHLAVVMGAPLAIVRRLVETYPKALKCTDDEHMLPFHLSMRHGAVDEIVDFLLCGFPDAVNVKGKNNRSVLECAMRSRKKARARMLAIFLSKTRYREAADLDLVRSKLEEKDRHLDELHMQLSAIETAKTLAEDDLGNKVSQLLDAKAELEAKLEELKHEKDSLELSSSKAAGQMNQSRIVHDIETERKIAALEAQKKELEEAERQIQEDEARLHSNLAVIEKRVGRSMATKDMDALKKDVTCFQTYRLEHTRSRALEDINGLKQSIQTELQQCKGAHKDEILAIQKSVQKLEDFDSSYASDDELAELRVELDRLKGELRLKKEAQDLRTDLLALKPTLEFYLGPFSVHDQETTAELKQAVEKITQSSLDKLECTSLIELRQEVTKLKMGVQEKSLITHAKKDLIDVQCLLEERIKTAEGKLRHDLLEKKKAIDSVEKAGLEGRPREELVSLHIEIINLKEGLKRNGASSQKKELVAALKKDISHELAFASGLPKQTLSAMKKELDACDKGKDTDMSNISLDTLSRHRQSLEALKRQRAEVKQIMEEIAQLQKQISAEMKHCKGVAKRELSGYLRDLEQMACQKLEEKSRIEIEAVKADYGAIKDKVSGSKEEFITKLEFSSWKESLEQRIASTTGEAQQEFVSMKETTDGINLETIQVKGKEGWRQLKAEIEILKLGLLRKDLVNLKRELSEDLKASSNAKQKEALNRALESIKLEDIDSASLGVLLTMKKDAEMYRSSATTNPKKYFFRNLFRRNKKQQRTAQPKLFLPDPIIEAGSQPIMPPQAPDADEASLTSSEPDSESNTSVPKMTRTMSYGNISGSNLKSSDVEVKDPSTAVSDRLPSTIMVEQGATRRNHIGCEYSNCS